MSADEDGFLIIRCDRTLPSGHAELRREDGSVLATFNDDEGAEAGLAFGDLMIEGEAASLVVASNVFARMFGLGTVH